MSLSRYPAYVATTNEFLGQIPTAWVKKRLKHVATLMMGQSPPSDCYLEIGEGLPFLQGCAEFGAVHPVPSVACDHATKLASVGALLFSVRAPVGRLNTADQVVGIGRGLCSITAHSLNQRFLMWVISALRTQLDGVATGSTYEAVSIDDVALLELVTPSAAEQVAIATFLDRETGKIDALVAEQERLIALLKEKRQAVISQAVTKGLNPDVPMKPSGVEWLGEVPAHWSALLGRHLFAEFDQRSTAGDEDLLTVSHLTGVTLRSEKTVNMIEAETTEGYKICRKGDLVINTLWAWMGAMGVSPIHGLVSPAYHVYALRDGVDPDYVNALVRMPVFAQETQRYSKGVWSSRLRLYPEELFQIVLPCPPIEEQRQIAAHVDREVSKMEGLLAEATRAITLLRERRAALISAAVTGKIDVRDAVHPAADLAAAA